MGTRDYGRYTLLKKLAVGGMAEVFLAQQKGFKGFEKVLVIKRILPHLAGDDEFVEMFLNEARIAARFNHPNIAQIFDLGKEDDTYFIAMEYIHGEDLGRVMKKAWSRGLWVPVPIALRIVASTCEGLHYAHSKTDERGNPLKVVHRDISPQNIIVGFEGNAKLVDFGIARAADQASHTQSGAIKGKYAYMAPEQASGKAIDNRTDLFALGLTLYELLTGVRPLKRDSDLMTLKAAVECNIEPPSKVAKVPPELDPIVMKALARVADDRYPDARAFQVAIEEFLVEQRWSASTVHVSEFMKELFADRLDEESEKGLVESDREELGSAPAASPVAPARKSRESWGTGDYPKASVPPPVAEEKHKDNERDLVPLDDDEWEATLAAANAQATAIASTKGRTKSREEPTVMAEDPRPRARVSMDGPPPLPQKPRTTPTWDAPEGQMTPPPRPTRSRADVKAEEPLPRRNSRPEVTVAAEEPLPRRNSRPEVTVAAEEPLPRRNSRPEVTVAAEEPLPRRNSKPELTPVAEQARPRTSSPPSTPARSATRERQNLPEAPPPEVAKPSKKTSRSILYATEQEIRDEKRRREDEVERKRRREDDARSPMAVEEMRGATRRGGQGVIVPMFGLAGLAVAAMVLVPSLRHHADELVRKAAEGNVPTGGGIVVVESERWSYLYLESNVTVDVMLGNRKLGSTPLKAAQVPVGTLTLTLVNPSFGIERAITVTTQEGKDVRHTEHFQLGRVRFKADQECEVYINGHRVARAPGPPLQYFEGTYEAECRNEGMGVLGRQKLTIARGSTAMVDVSFKLDTKM